MPVNKRTSMSLPQPTIDQLAALKAIYQNYNTIIVVAIERLYQEEIILRLTKSLDLASATPDQLAFVAMRGALFQIGEQIEQALAETEPRPLRYNKAIELLQWVMNLAKEAAID